MNILIPDNWLKDFLTTGASPENIARCISLCGPSVEKIISSKTGPVYSIEVTTNRVDTASVYGIARETAAILPRFGIKAKLKPIHITANYKFLKKVNYLTVAVDHNLCSRFTAVLIKNVNIKDSPLNIKERLTTVNLRPINNVVDISNYIMHELGQPVHTFDYDKIKGAKMILRNSKAGETIRTLDGVNRKLPGGDIVIEDGSGRLIDLAGIMGGENSAVDDNTKNVLLFVQTYNPVNIRKTSMTLAHRTEAAVIFEKGPDPEMVESAIKKAIDMFVFLTNGKPEKEILDLYPNPFKPKRLKVMYEFVQQRLGLNINKADIKSILNSLGFESVWTGNMLNISVPSFRSNDINIPEDVLEEIARIYGYHNLPSIIMGGIIPNQPTDTPFNFEMKIKNILKGFGGIEIYTQSLVAKEQAGEKALRLKNPLGKESEYLRTSLMPSLVQAAMDNTGVIGDFHLFEIANTYLPTKNNLPEEKTMVAGIFASTNFREAKGIIECLLNGINIKASFIPEDSNNFLASQRLSIKAGNNQIGEFGVLKNSYIYYQFPINSLINSSVNTPSYKPLPKYPPQIEDLTLSFPPKTRIGEVLTLITNHSSLTTSIELRDVYNDNYTFRIWYQHPTKTLTDKEVEKIREGLLQKIKVKFGGVVKS